MKWKCQETELSCERYFGRYASKLVPLPIQLVFPRRIGIRFPLAQALECAVKLRPARPRQPTLKSSSFSLLLTSSASGD